MFLFFIFLRKQSETIVGNVSDQTIKGLWQEPHTTKESPWPGMKTRGKLLKSSRVQNKEYVFTDGNITLAGRQLSQAMISPMREKAKWLKSPHLKLDSVVENDCFKRRK